MEKVGIWKYKPRERWGNKEDILGFKDTLGNPFIEDFKVLFKDKQVQELVKENDWLSIFDIWDKDRILNRPGWVIEMLWDTLYWLEVDFWNYLPESFYPLKYSYMANKMFYK